MDDKAIKLLLIEDSKTDAALIQHMLKEAQKASFHVEIRDTLTKGLERLAEGGIKIILLDLTLPDSLGLDNFGRIHAHAPNVPIIVIAASSDEMQALMAFQKGAQDYLIKGQINSDLLERSIRYAIERHTVSVALLQSQERFKEVVASAEAWIWEIDKEGLFTYSSPIGEKILQVKPEEIIGKRHFYDFFAPDVRDKAKKQVLEIIEKKERFKNLIVPSVNKNGDIVIVESSGAPIFDGDGKFIGYRGANIDVTTRIKMEQRIEKINNCFLTFGEDPTDNICRLTALFGEMLGATCALYNCFDRERMLCSIGQWHTPKDYNPKDRPEGHICYDVITKGEGRYFLIRNLQETQYARTDPNVKQYKLETYLGYPIKWKNEFVGSLCAVYDKDFVPSEEDLKLVSIIAAAVEVEEKRRRAEESLRDSEERFRIIFESTTDCILVWDKNYNYLYANQAAIDHVGTTRDKVIGKNIQSGLGHIPEFMKLWMGRVDKVFQTQKPMRVEDAVMVGNRLVYSESVLSPLRDKSGNVFAVGVVYRDITDRRHAEQELQKVNKELIRSNKRLNQLALRDPDTGLYNHKYLAEIIDAEFHRAKRYNTPLSVVMLDVDYFKSINEIYGHKFGDLVLKQLAQQLRKMTRQYDVIIRYGGEEFIIISPGTDRYQGMVLAQRILDAVYLYNFGNDKNAVKLKISLAAVSYPEDKVTSAMDLVKISEQMLTRAKEEGGNRVYSSMDKKKSIKGLGQLVKGKGVNILKDRLYKLNREANQSLIESIFAFAKTIELKDHYTGEHAERTVKYATNIAAALGLSKAEIEMVRQAAMLHDLGKIGISERILTKKATLTAKELEEIRKHPKIAADILRPIHVLSAIIPFILYHHERWDGKGYPDGLKGEDIPLSARIVAIADVYQALISNRPYRKAFSKTDAIKIIKEGSGTQFDPQIVNIFLNILKKENRK